MPERRTPPVDAELVGRLVEDVQRGGLAVVGDPDLDLDEDIVATQGQSAEDLVDGALALLQGAFVMALSTRDGRTLSAVAKTMKLLIEPGGS
jgi:hypothetical protein